MEGLLNLGMNGGGGCPGSEGLLSGGRGHEIAADKSRIPDLAGILGAAAADLQDSSELRQAADELWKHLDGLAAKDPAAYQLFIAEQAKEVGIMSPLTSSLRSSDAADEHPVLVLEASVSGAGVPSAALALLHIWAATEKAAVRAASTGDHKAVSSSTASWTGLRVPLRTHHESNAFRHTKGCMVYNYHLLCNSDTLHLAAVCTPAQLYPLVVEAACQFVEHKHSVQISRTARRLQVNTAFLPAAERAQHLEQQKAAMLACAASGTAAELLSTGTLSKLSSMALRAGVSGGGRSYQDSASTNQDDGKSSSKPLIQEVPPVSNVAGNQLLQVLRATTGQPDGSHQLQVTVVTTGQQREVVLTAHLPSVQRASDVDLNIHDGCVHLTAAGEVLRVKLSELVDVARARAKFDLKRKVLTVRLPMT